MMRVLQTVGATLAALACGGGLLAWSGLYDVGASSGHWPITRAFLQFGMRNSVETHSLGIAAPDLADPALIMRGAGHFQGGCAPCHGAPGEPQAAVTRHMLPAPPELSGPAQEWDEAELFWIVKHGLKYTGMPGWPAPQRDDEVWAMVAFLHELPGLGVAEYRRLAMGEAADPVDDGAALAHTGPAGRSVAGCVRCHGLDGAGRGLGAYPRIGGQSAEYLYGALREYAVGARASGIMQTVATELSEAEMRALASHYADQRPALPEPPPADPALLARGEAIALRGAPERGVPACAACHGAQGRSANPLFPMLAGQFAGYTAQQLRLFREGVRGDTPAAQIMAAAARGLDEEQIRAVSIYYATHPPR